ncbi:hypothetical protein G9A89_023238 [Geosiphon pyriformis]|nr:hypothetical protein G9A89_023238 [Geosiphon pyriformis]
MNRSLGMNVEALSNTGDSTSSSATMNLPVIPTTIHTNHRPTSKKATQRVRNNQNTNNSHHDQRRTTRRPIKVVNYHESSSTFSSSDEGGDDEKDKDQSQRATFQREYDNNCLGLVTMEGQERQDSRDQNSHSPDESELSDPRVSSDEEIDEAPSDLELGFSAFNQRFLAYHKDQERERIQLAQENQVTSRKIESLRARVHILRSDSDAKLTASREIELTTDEITQKVAQIRIALLQLEREIGPTVRSSGVRLDDAENLAAYVDAFRERVASGCLLQPE